MSNDGIAAAKIIKDSGGKIITQLESSCVLSSIVAGVKEKISINFEGTPKEMAQYIINK
jgi:chemotaxis response regulator CheB